MNTDVDYLSELLELINKIENLVNDSSMEKLREDDVRKKFFKMLVSTLKVYHFGLSIEVLKLKDSGNIGISIESPEKPFVDIYSEILKMNLINDCWVCFESTLREIFYVKEPTKYKNQIWEIYTNEVFNSNDVNLTEIDNLNKSEDNKKFLGFLGHCRNAMHNNFIHDPKKEKNEHNNWEYFIDKENNYKLKLGKKIEFMDREAILKIIEKLSDVALNMWKNLDHPDFIHNR